MFKTYLSNYYPDIKRILMQYVSCPSTAEDLRGRIIEKVLKHEDKFVGDEKDFQKWMSIVIRNEFINFYRVEKNKPAFNHLDIVKNSPGINSTYEQKELLENVLSFIRTQRHSDVYQLYIKGWKYEDISSELKMPLGSVKVAIRNLKLTIRETFKNAYTI